ncbi:hypothetical protein OIV83_005031 [Microbotryomycetes sp. JL201]|nr:hypothetical protein OIV83_005031 [Microbotryomycetes sp. JL201]
MPRGRQQGAEWTKDQILSSLYLAGTYGAGIVAAFETLHHLILAPDDSNEGVRDKDVFDLVVKYLSDKGYRTDNFRSRFYTKVFGSTGRFNEFKNAVRGALSVEMEWMKFSHEAEWAHYNHEAQSAAQALNDEVTELYRVVYEVLMDQSHPSLSGHGNHMVYIGLSEIINQDRPLVFLCLSIAMAAKKAVAWRCRSQIVQRLPRDLADVKTMMRERVEARNPGEGEDKLAHAGYVTLLSLRAAHHHLSPEVAAYETVYRMMRQSYEIKRLQDESPHILPHPEVSQLGVAAADRWNRSNAVFVTFFLLMLENPMKPHMAHVFDNAHSGHMAPNLGEEESSLDWLVFCHSMSQKPNELSAWARASQDHLSSHERAPDDWEVPDLLHSPASPGNRSSVGTLSPSLSTRKARLFYGIDPETFRRKWT